MHFFFLHHPVKNLAEPDEHALVPVHEHGHNTNEGSEFLDDALRMEDMSALYPEENITDGET